MARARDEFLEALHRNRSDGTGVAVSVCSAHPDVLRATFRVARQHDTFALIESTSNQVDQYGGYTGMQPGDFVAKVHAIAQAEAFPRDRILLGGDHLGPNRWRDRDAAAAMQEAKTLAAAYVAAGYEKIHLDASFVCADDAPPLSDEIVAKRCAEMARVCEDAAGTAPPLYVIGTEVPTPGGALADEVFRPTSPAEAARTLQVFESVFREQELAEAWGRVVGLVVQPGVEFSDDHVENYPGDHGLRAAIEPRDGMVFEAHSTDYQLPENLRRMVENHFFILKVGPWLTFALRESLLALEAAERELNPAQPSEFRATLLRIMREDPVYWRGYYDGDDDAVAYKLIYSYSDRCRYYLAHPEVAAAQARLVSNLSSGVPDAMISQHLPEGYWPARHGRMGAADLVLGRVQSVLNTYFAAGGPR